jgi:hypothetical protein
MRRSLLIIVAVVILCILYRPRYHKPRVYRNVFSPKMCQHIIKLASNSLEPSTVSEDRDVDDTIRKSKTAWLDPKSDRVVNHMVKTCASFTDRPSINCEHLQVLRYRPGGFYTEHQDTFEKHLEANYRMYTCIIGLNEGYEGGETEFTRLKTKYRLNTGDVLVFNTLNDWDMFTDNALHAGTTVRSGEKWICNLWIHKHEFVPGEIN